MLGRRATAVFVQYGSGSFAGRTVHVPRQNLKHANVPKSNGAHLSGCPLHSDTSVRVRATSCARKQQWVTWICSMQGENVTNLPPSFSASFAKTQHSLRRRYAHTRTARRGGGGRSAPRFWQVQKNRIYFLRQAGKAVGVSVLVKARHILRQPLRMPHQKMAGEHTASCTQQVGVRTCRSNSARAS